MKKLDPLWAIIGEKVYLQGVTTHPAASCPQCHVLVELPEQSKLGARFRCGLCGTLSEVIDAPRETGVSVRQILEHV